MFDGLFGVSFHLPINSLALTYGSTAQTLDSSLNLSVLSLETPQ